MKVSKCIQSAIVLASVACIASQGFAKTKITLNQDGTCQAKDGYFVGWAFPFNYSGTVEELAYDNDVDVDIKVFRKLAGRNIQFKANGNCRDVQNFARAYQRWIDRLDNNTGEY